MPPQFLLLEFITNIMEKYNKVCISLLLMAMLLVSIDVCKFLYALPLSYAYPILPFNTYPSFVRGTNRHRMNGILDIREYSDVCGMIGMHVENPQKLDSLCIYSVLQYAWKKDSLLMEVSLADNSRRWLLASPASSSEYKCKLQEEDIRKIDFFTWHNVKLEDHLFQRIFRQTELHVALGIAVMLLAIYVTLIISTIVLNIWCVIYAVKHRDDIDAEQIIAKRLIYIYAPIFPFVIWVLCRVLTFITIH